MSVLTNFRTWLGPGLNLGRYIKGHEHAVFLAAEAVIFVHLLSQAFIDPEPMSTAADNIVTGIAGPALVALIAGVYPRLAIGFRAAAAAVLGVFAAITGLVIHGSHAVAVGVGVSDVTGIAAATSGLVLVAMGIWLAWKALPHLALKLALIPVIPILLLQLVLPLALATFVVNTPRQALGDESPADYGLAYEDVRFETEDGVTIAGWYTQSENGAAVILVHGAGKNRTKTLDHAAMLARHGFGTLMIDVRGYGESEGSPVAFGWTGEMDTSAALRYLQARDDVDPERIGALGLSMGGEIVIQTAGENEDLKAVVAEGNGMHTWREFEQDEGPAIEYIALFNVWNAYSFIELMSGVEQPSSNKDLITEIAPRPVLLISTGSGEEGMWGRVLHEAGGPTTQLWETGGSHINGLEEQPDEYASRVVALFNEALLGD